MVTPFRVVLEDTVDWLTRVVTDYRQQMSLRIVHICIFINCALYKCGWPSALLDMDFQIIWLSGCLTVLTKHSGWNSSPGKCLTHSLSADPMHVEFWLIWKDDFVSMCLVPVPLGILSSPLQSSSWAIPIQWTSVYGLFWLWLSHQ